MLNVSHLELCEKQGVFENSLDWLDQVGLQGRRVLGTDMMDRGMTGAVCNCHGTRTSVGKKG